MLLSHIIIADTTQAANDRLVVQLSSILGGASMVVVVLVIVLVICFGNWKHKKKEHDAKLRDDLSSRFESNDWGGYNVHAVIRGTTMHREDIHKLA